MNISNLFTICDISNLLTKVQLDETLSIIMDSLSDGKQEIQGLNKVNKKNFCI